MSNKSAMRRLLDERPELAPRVREMFPAKDSISAALTAIQAKQKRKKPNDDAEREFAFQIKSHRLPPPATRINSKKALTYQYYFARDTKGTGLAPRDFRADFAWPEYDLLVEVQGGIWMPGSGAHSHPVDITRDIERAQYAAILGCFVLPVTTDQVKNGFAIAVLQRVLYASGWKGPNNGL